LEIILAEVAAMFPVAVLAIGNEITQKAKKA
jgi:hypothetical protein